MSRVIDSVVMLVGAFIIGWHLVPPDAAQSRQAPASKAEVAAQPANETPRENLLAKPLPAECPEAPPPEYARPPPAPQAQPGPDELPRAYRDIIGPLASNSP